MDTGIRTRPRREGALKRRVWIAAMSAALAASCGDDGGGNDTVGGGTVINEIPPPECNGDDCDLPGNIGWPIPCLGDIELALLYWDGAGYNLPVTVLDENNE